MVRVPNAANHREVTPAKSERFNTQHSVRSMTSSKGVLQMVYRYKMVQIPPQISVRQKDVKGQEAALYLEQVVSEYAKSGWEFQRVDEIGVNQNPGCIAGLFGAKTTKFVYYVITFRQNA